MQLIKRTSPAVLLKLPVREQLQLMKQLRGNLLRQPPEHERWNKFRSAQSKLYRAMRPDGAFLKEEKALPR